MKQYLLSFLFLSIAFTSNLFAQDNITWSPQRDMNVGLKSSIDLLGFDDNYYYVRVKPDVGHGSLLTYTYDHKLKQDIAIKLKKGKAKFVPRGFSKINNTLFGYMPEYDKGILFMHIAKVVDGRYAEVKKIKVQSYGMKLKGLWYSWLDYKGEETNDYFGFITSPNEKITVFTTTISTIHESKKDKIALAVLDENMNLVREAIYDLPYKGSKFRIEQVIVTDDGEIFYTGISKIKKKNRGKNGLNFDFKVFRISENGMNEVQISINDRSQIVNAKLLYDNHLGNVYLGGFYREQSKLKMATGVFCNNINLDNNEIRIKESKFSEDFSKEYIEREKDIVFGTIPFSFIVKELVSFPDGTISIIAEEYIERKSTESGVISLSGAVGVTKTRETYISNDLITSKFAEDGELIHINKISKEFASDNKGAASYLAKVVGNDLYLLFNDRKDYDERQEIGGQGLKKSRKGTDLCIIGKDGKLVERKTIFTKKDISMIFLPQLSFFKEGSFILAAYAKMNREFRFGTL